MKFNAIGHNFHVQKTNQPTQIGWKFSWDIPHTYLRYLESFVRGNDEELIYTFCPLFDSRVLTITRSNTDVIKNQDTDSKAQIVIDTSRRR